jgi:hypothetical protein
MEQWGTADLTLNAAVLWDAFDSESYFEDNYSDLRHDDRAIVHRIRDFFAAADIPVGAAGIDVGTGPNLYPALAMLPFVDSLVLYEYSAHNIDWLTAQQAGNWPAWHSGLRGFWDIFLESPPYKSLGPDPRGQLGERSRIVQGSIFDLDRAAEDRFDVGSMFFVAESLSEDHAEFDHAVERFLGVLRPGAPFAAAFMEQSTGYDVGGRRFPATAVSVADVEASLRRGAADVVLERMGTDGSPLRDGYSGMILAVGRRSGADIAADIAADVAM